MKSLVIVESPTKRQTIGKYLKDLPGDFDVQASIGHIRDLATSGKDGLGVDVEHGFIPRYVVNKKKVEVVNNLKAATKKVDEIILATDPDREGEAIAWHLAEVLGLDIKTTKRIEFHEITRESIKQAMLQPRMIDMDMKASQETRRIFDRISGFKLSKLLQKKIKSRSAGRVQSVALKMIVDREREILAFIPEEYWTLSVELLINQKGYPLTLSKVDGKKVDIKNEDEALAILARIETKLPITNIKVSERKREPKFPFKTSTLQQEAAARFGFDTKRSSRIAQTLYEGVSLGAEQVGLITYIRTDSVRLSETFLTRAHSYIQETYGSKYVAPVKKVKAGLLAQDAHEAIRPTSNHRTPDSIKEYLSPDQYKLYRLIYERTLASLMPDQVEEVTTYTCETNGIQFTLERAMTLFDGFTIVTGKSDNDDKKVPLLTLGEHYPVHKKEAKQNMTNPPPRLTEAKLIEEMEKNGIGRPSTYSSTIETLKMRDYVTAKKGTLTPTDQGKCTVQYLELYFTDSINPTFTAKMEQQLDEVQDGNNSASDILSNFYETLITSIEKAGELPNLESCIKDFGPCPKCGEGRLIEKKGKYGKFIACSRFPTCHYIQKEIKEAPEAIGRSCPKCGGALVKRFSKKRKSMFIGCINFPKCNYLEALESEKEAHRHQS